MIAERATGRGSTGRSWWIGSQRSCVDHQRRHPVAAGDRDRAARRARRPRGAPRRDPLLWRLLPALVAAAIAAVYLIVEPRTVDLAAAVFRARLFGEAGFTIWNNTGTRGIPPGRTACSFPAARGSSSPALLGRPVGRRSRRRCSSRSRAATSARARHAGERSGSAPARRRRCSRVESPSPPGWRAASPRCSRCSAAGERSPCLLALVCGLLSPIAGLSSRSAPSRTH